jgi:lactoylglutathione lyase
LVFIIEEISTLAKHLKEQGVKLIGEGPTEVRKGVFALYSLDPEGNYVEFVEYPDIASYRPDLYK